MGVQAGGDPTASLPARKAGEARVPCLLLRKVRGQAPFAARPPPAPCAGRRRDRTDRKSEAVTRGPIIGSDQSVRMRLESKRSPAHDLVGLCPPDRLLGYVGVCPPALHAKKPMHS